MTDAETADAFLAIAADFQLGALDTEQSHPLTRNLSHLVQKNLPAAVDALRAVDAQALASMAGKLGPAPALAQDIHATWQEGGRVFLAGCGATGRLSLALETFTHTGLLPEALHRKVISFMAGGDAALIRAIEGFEDFPDYGARQLRELGFRDGDLLIASTEGGETPWVIGATEEATLLSARPPWFCYCNPDTELRAQVERSRRVLDNQAIRKWNLAVGPMAIAGSTRLQASTALQFGIGLALEHAAQENFARQSFSARLDAFRASALAGWEFLPAFIAYEANIYARSERVLYATENCGITTLTDTTERAPTFSLPAFESFTEEAMPIATSLCYLHLPGHADTAAAWHALLGREPRCLDWPPELPVTRRAHLLGHDISAQATGHRARTCPGARHHTFAIDADSDGAIRWTLGEHTAEAVPAGLPLLEAQTRLKLLLNAHSTLVMGRLGRYAGNLMTYVKPSNHKLVDRAIRYVQTLYGKAHGKPPDYAVVCRELFRQRACLGPGEPIVLKTLTALEASI